jgi:hypothetical protein
MRSLSIAFALAIIGAAIAAPTSDATVPELSLIQSDEAVKNAEAAVDAKKVVQSMLETGSDASACQDLADAILTEVQDNIKHQEELLSYMPDGSACKSEGQDVVDAAQAAVDSAQTTKTSADAAAAAAASAPVDFGSYPLSSISLPSTCTQFENDPAYTAAMTTSQQAQNAATTAAAELTAAQNELESAQEAQANAIKKCECDAYTAYDAAYKAANTRSDEDLAAWKKGKHMQCVLAGTDPSACDVGSPPEVKRCALAEGVDASSCSAMVDGCWPVGSRVRIKPGTRYAGQASGQCGTVTNMVCEGGDKLEDITFDNNYRNSYATTDFEPCPSEVLLQQDDTCKIGQIKAPTCVMNKCRVKMLVANKSNRRRTVSNDVTLQSYDQKSQYYGDLGTLKVDEIRAYGEGCNGITIYDDDKAKKVHNMDFPLGQGVSAANKWSKYALTSDLENDVKGIKISVQNKNPANCVKP